MLRSYRCARAVIDRAKKENCVDDSQELQRTYEILWQYHGLRTVATTVVGKPVGRNGSVRTF